VPASHSSADKLPGRIGILVLWPRSLSEKTSAIFHWETAATRFVNVFRNGGTYARRLKSRFGNVDRSSVSLFFEAGLFAANTLAVSFRRSLRFSID
jgi:hypothetical protein